MSGESFEGQTVSQRVIEAVAAATDSDPTEVGPLYHVIDPDALDRLFSATRGSGRTQGFVEFTFAGCDVVVRSDGDVEVSEQEFTTAAGEPPEEASTATNVDDAR